MSTVFLSCLHRSIWVDVLYYPIHWFSLYLSLLLKVERRKNVKESQLLSKLQWGGYPTRRCHSSVPYIGLYTETCVNSECIQFLLLTDRSFKVISKAVLEKWAKNVLSALYFVGNEALGKYNISSGMSIDSLYDEYSTEIGYALSVKTVLKKKEELEYLL